MNENTSTIDTLMDKALQEKIFPGASLLVGHKEKIIYQKDFGLAEEIPLHRELQPDALFDIASLTKPFCTATLFMVATQKMGVSLETPLNYYYPDLTNPEIKIKHLLNHSSGLPDWKPYHLQLVADHPDWMLTPAGRDWFIDLLVKECETALPEKRILYSDLGYILLGDVLERIYHKPLHLAFEDEIAVPLKLKSTFFNPILSKRDSLPDHFAATEICSWRQKLLCGEVHDDNAWILNGVAGHAGLFSTATDVFTWMNELDKARQGKSSFIKKEIFDLFCFVPENRDSQHLFFTFGFDTPSRPSSAGHYFSETSLGHLGYTGTSFGWDLKEDFVIILLTNRVHPSRNNEKIKEFRPLLHNHIREWANLV